MKPKFNILTSYWFIGALLILIINDFILKNLFHNWITGKLSDFSGLFVFSIFWIAFIPKRKTTILWITGLLFIFWKSSYSQIMIDEWNWLGILSISRVVDYSDLIALIMIPLAYQIYSSHKTLWRLNLNPIIPIILASFAFMATSYHTKVPINKTYRFNFSKDTLIHRLGEIDSLNNGNSIVFINQNQDTTSFTLPSDICFDKIDVQIVINETKKETTSIKLIDADHRCPKKTTNKDELIIEFERVVIDKLTTK